MTLIRYEIKKIVKKRIFLVVCILILLIEGVYTVSAFLNVEYDTIDGTLSGKEAIEAFKAEQESISGRLDEDYLLRVYETYHEIKSNPDNLLENGDMKDAIYVKKWMKYADIQTLMIKNHSEINGNIDVDIMDKLDRDQMLAFYDQWEEYVVRENKIYTPFNKDNVSANKDRLNLNEKKPFHVDYDLGYTIFFQNSGVIITVLLLLSTLFIVPVFTYDYTSGAHLLISTSQKGRKEICNAKYKAAFIVSTMLYFGAIGAFLLQIRGFFSFDGGDTSIQVLFMGSSYKLTVMEAVIVTLLIGYVAYMAFVGLALFISILTKKMSVALCVSLVLLLVPQILSGSGNPILEWVNKISFTSLMDVKQVLIMHQGIAIGSQFVLPIIVLQIIGVGCITAGALMIGKKVYASALARS